MEKRKLRKRRSTILAIAISAILAALHALTIAIVVTVARVLATTSAAVIEIAAITLLNNRQKSLQ
jgi:hypothetical protein